MLVTVDHCLKMPGTESHLRHFRPNGAERGETLRGETEDPSAGGVSAPGSSFTRHIKISRIHFSPAEGFFKIPIILWEESQGLITCGNG